MHLDDARRCLLLRAFESPITPPWSQADATWAGDEARRRIGETADADRFVAERARQGLRRLGERRADLRPRLERLAQGGGHGRTAAVGIVAVTFATGIAADAVGGEGRIHLLAPPLLLLVAWNLVVYAGLAVGGLVGLGRRRGQDGAGVLRRLTAGLLARAGEGRSGWRPARADDPPPSEATEGAAMRRFAATWAPMAAPVWAARGAALLHAGAASLAAGAIASLYLRGLAFEYRAGWDSTFLSAQQALALLSSVLGPAASATGLVLPDAAGFAALRFSGGPGENAARWIHLWAATLAGAVVVPRLLLAGLAAARAARRERRVELPWTEPYFARLAGARAGRELVLRVLPFRHRPQPQAQPVLAEALHRAFGPHAAVRLLEPVDEGAEDEGVARAAGAAGVDGGWLVGLVSLSATPERETHGRVVQALDGRRGPGQPRLLLIDESGFGARFSAADAQVRREQRRAAWRAFADDLDHRAVFLDLASRPLSIEAQDALVAALQPATR